MVFYGYISMENKLFNKLRSILAYIVLLIVPVYIASTNPVFACPNGPNVSCNSALWSMGNSHTINSFPTQGKLRIWTTMGGGQRLEISKNGSVIQNAYPTTGVAATLDVVASDRITVRTYDCYGSCTYPNVGWKTENTGSYANTCGTGCPCPPSRGKPDGNYGFADSTSFRSMVQNGDNGNPLGPLQCWGDWDEWGGDYDFNDYMMWYTFEESCNCTPVACPAGESSTKFRTRAVPQGTGVSCNNCVPSSYNCDPLYRNATPSCSINTASISLTREDQPKSFTLSVSDNDYGDTVNVLAVRVENSSGNLNSCATIKSAGGGSLIGATVRNGSDNPAAITQATQFLVDARESHGLFENISGRSLCSGFLEIDIADQDSDGPGPDVASTPVTCRVAIQVENQAPQLSSIVISDADSMTAVQDKGATGNGNLLDGRSQIIMGTTYSSQTKARASYCSESLTIDDPIICPIGAEKFETSMSQRRNPLLVEYTVRDANGSDDIMQAGIWLQRTALNRDVVALPLVQSGMRNSIQAMYSEKENSHIVNLRAAWNLISTACLGSTCVNPSLLGSAKQQFSALALINELGQTVGSNGNIKEGKMQWASQRDWQEKGFPDCQQTPSGCTNSNLPSVASITAGTNAQLLENYDWAIAADANHLICYSSQSAVPTVLPVSVPVSTCPAQCAACVKREGIVPSVSDPTALTFRFGVYFNDKDGGQGMPEGEYSIFVSALDKVSAPLGNAIGKGDEGWLKFDKSRNLCLGAMCPAGGEVTLLYDPIPPTVNYVSWAVQGLTGAAATFSMNDNVGGSGIKGVTNRFMIRQEELDDEALGDRAWALKEIGGIPYDGKNDRKSITGNSITIIGEEIGAGNSIVTGLCVYDGAGNMGCGRNKEVYVFLGPWLKTSYGDVYSAKGGAVPFAQSLPTDDGTTNDNTRNVYAPFTRQSFTLLTGYFMTAGSPAQGTGLTGGHLVGGQNMQLGFDNYYRYGVTEYDLFGHVPFLPGNEYDRLRSTAILNCERMNTESSGTCQTTGSLSSIGQADLNILYSSGGTVVSDISCSKANVIFVTGNLIMRGQVKKTAGAGNGCVFVLANGASLTIEDVPSDLPRPPAGDGKGSPIVDRFDAAIIATSSAQLRVTKGERGATTKSTDRLEIHGWVYASDTVPLFKRNLAPVDNRRYPSEWIVYDASLLDTLRPLLGTEKTVDLICGTSTHALCQAGQ